MAFNGSGTFVRLYNWVVDKGNSVGITASRMDAEQDGIATGLSNCITKDGQTVITANIPMASNKLTGLAVGSARTDSITLGQVQDNTYGNLGASSGTDTYTASPSPAITAYTANQRYTLEIGVDNTGAATLNISAVGAEALEKYDGAGALTALEAGDLQANQKYDIVRDQANTKFVVLNPEIPSASASEAGIVELLTNAELATGTDTTRAATAAAILSLLPASSLTTNGYASTLINNGGFDNLIFQFGRASAPSNGQSTYSFPLTFPNAVLAAVGNKTAGAPSGVDAADSGVIAISTSQFKAFSDDGGRTISWIAIGY